MARVYDVFWENKIVGHVKNIREGLYYKISCHCSLQDRKIYRLMVQCNGQTCRLGILSPVEFGFDLNTQISVRQLGEGNMTFYLEVPCEKTNYFIPVFEKESFQYFSVLSYTCMDIRNEIHGLIIPNQFLSRLDNDRNR